MMTAKFTPKRGRPSNNQVLAIDRAILDTARRILLEDGFDALAMDAVAAELRISKGTLYVRHPSKEALTQAVIREAVEDWSKQSAVNDHLLPTELAPRLRQHLRIMGRKSADPEVLKYVQLWTSIQQRDPELALIFHNGFNRGVAAIAADIEAAGERDGMPPRDANGTATLLLSTLTGWFTQQIGVREVPLEEIDATADRIVDVFLAGRSAW